jgi:hypothetical protein
MLEADEHRSAKIAVALLFSVGRERHSLPALPSQIEEEVDAGARNYRGRLPPPWNGRVDS